ncbi:hypothetical protein SAMN03097699_0173 [Flavobacteriaceae bacterium MAR_2010_188]|nr:hypothetical protein SAMN03097699_0173 [Flavobacteriaceae bacterium MAR_2010_188]
MMQPNLALIKNYPITLLLFSAVFMFVIITLLLNLLSLAFNPAFIPPDTSTYINAANVFYKYLDFSPTRPMGYPILLGIPHFFIANPTNDDLISWGYILNFCFWLASVYFLYKSLLVMVQPVQAFVFTFLFITCVSNIAQTSVILTESLSCFLLTLLLYFLVLFAHTKRLISMGFVTLIITVLILVKPGFIYLGIVFNLILWGYHFFKGETPSLKIVFPLFIIYLLIFVQSYHNYSKHGNFTISYIDKYTWYLYIGAEASADSKSITYSMESDLRSPYFQSLTLREKHELASQDLAKQLKLNKGLVIKHLFLNIIENGHRGNPHIAAVGYHSKSIFLRYIRHYLYLFSRLQNVTLSLTAVFLCLALVLTSLRRSLMMWMLCSIIFYVMFTSGISFWQGDRFHIVLYPLIIFGSARLAHQMGWFHAKTINNYQ